MSVTVLCFGPRWLYDTCSQHPLLLPNNPLPLPLANQVPLSSLIFPNVRQRELKPLAVGADGILMKKAEPNLNGWSKHTFSNI